MSPAKKTRKPSAKKNPAKGKIPEVKVIQYQHSPIEWPEGTPKGVSGREGPNEDRRVIITIQGTNPERTYVEIETNRIVPEGVIVNKMSVSLGCWEAMQSAFQDAYLQWMSERMAQHMALRTRGDVHPNPCKPAPKTNPAWNASANKGPGTTGTDLVVAIAETMLKKSQEGGAKTPQGCSCTTQPLPHLPKKGHISASLKKVYGCHCKEAARRKTELVGSLKAKKTTKGKRSSSSRTISRVRS